MLTASGENTCQCIGFDLLRIDTLIQALRLISKR